MFILTLWYLAWVYGQNKTCLCLSSHRKKGNWGLGKWDSSQSDLSVPSGKLPFIIWRGMILAATPIINPKGTSFREHPVSLSVLVKRMKCSHSGGVWEWQLPHAPLAWLEVVFVFPLLFHLWTAAWKPHEEAQRSFSPRRAFCCVQNLKSTVLEH